MCRHPSGQGYRQQTTYPPRSRYEAIQRLAILAMIAKGFLSWIFLRSKRLVGGLFGFTSRFRKESKFAYYRLLDGLQSFARLYHLYIVGTRVKPLKNG